MTNETNTIDLGVEAFSANLTTQRTALVTQLEQLDQQRAEVVKGMASIDRILRALSGKEAPQGSTGVRKPMSAEGKENIRRALNARRDRLAAEAAAKAVEPVAVAEAAPETPEMPAEAPKTPAKKAVKHAGK